jgi:hypothetical protein
LQDLDIDDNISDKETDLIKTDFKDLSRFEQALAKEFSFVCGVF